MRSLDLAKHEANGYNDASKLLSAWSSTFGGDQPHSLQHYALLNLRKGDCRASSPESLHARTLNKHCGERATILTQKRCFEPSIARGACWGVSHRATLYWRPQRLGVKRCLGIALLYSRGLTRSHVLFRMATCPSLFKDLPRDGDICRHSRCADSSPPTVCCLPSMVSRSHRNQLKVLEQEGLAHRKAAIQRAMLPLTTSSDRDCHETWLSLSCLRGRSSREPGYLAPSYATALATDLSNG